MPARTLDKDELDAISNHYIIRFTEHVHQKAFPEEIDPSIPAPYPQSQAQPKP